GGDSGDNSHGIAVDGSGNAYVVGTTNFPAATFPVKVGPDLTANGGSDAFVAKVAADGASLVYAGFIGGAADDFGNGITVGGSGDAYVVSTTNPGATFPTKVGPDLTANGGSDAFVAKVAADGASLVYAGFIGGDSEESGNDIAVDSSGSAYVTG